MSNKQILFLEPAVKTPPPIHSIINTLEQICSCVICLDRIQQPKTLVCEHSFCKECLDKLVVINAGVARIECPSCRVTTNLKPGETVASLEASLFLKQTINYLQEDDRCVLFASIFCTM